jgi:hypothetical protein
MKNLELKIGFIITQSQITYFSYPVIINSTATRVIEDKMWFKAGADKILLWANSSLMLPFLGGEWNWSLNSRLSDCKAGALLLDPHLQSILLWLFWRCGLMTYFPKLVSNCDPQDLSLPSS